VKYVGIFVLTAYLQEVGRAGRDGDGATAQLYFNKNDIAGNVPGLKPIVREFCLTTECRWKVLCHYFNCDLVVNNILHKCCDNCRLLCECEDCTEQHMIESDVDQMSSHVIDHHTSDMIKATLQAYFEAENNALVHSVFGGVLYTGLTDNLAHSLSSDYPNLTDACQIKDKFPYLEDKYIHNISRIVSHILSNTATEV
jgi:hypothetical protein